MIEIKEEDVEISQDSWLDGCNDKIWWIMKRCDSKEEAEQLKQQILQDHEDAKKLKTINKESIGFMKAFNWLQENEISKIPDHPENEKNRQIIKKLTELHFGVLLQSLRDDFSEDKNHVPNDVLKKMVKNTETIMNIQKTLEGKK